MTLASDWEVVVVSKDSNIENANELMKQLKQNKKNFKIGVAPGLETTITYPSYK